MWSGDEFGNIQFSGGREAWVQAANLARTCTSFRPDDEDEQCAEEDLSCYNCRYRRWTAASFSCQAISR